MKMTSRKSNDKTVLAFVVTAMIVLASCSDSPLNSEISSQRSKPAKIVEVANGSKLAKGDDSVAKITTESAEVLINPSSLQVDTTVSVGDFKTSDTSYIASELGIKDTSLKSVKVAKVTASSNAPLAQPMTIKLKIGQSLMAAFLSDPNYFVVYTYQDQNGRSASGLISGKMLTIEGRYAIFTVKRFGVYELFETKQAAPEPKTLASGQLNAFGKDIEVSTVSSRLFESNQDITVTGQHFDASTRVTVLGHKVAVRYISPEAIAFKVPSLPEFGSRQFKVMNRYKSLAQAMFYKGDKTDRPFIAAEPAAVCRGVAYYDAKGAKQQGSKICVATDFSVCSGTLLQDCRLAADYRQLDETVLKARAGDVAAGHKIGGIPGTLRFNYTLCQGDGQMDCRATADYPAVKGGDILGGSIKHNESIGGVDGTYYAEPKTDCTAQKTGDCKIPATNGAFVAVPSSQLKAGDIRKTKKIGEVIGTFPSGEARLGEQATPDLMANAMREQLKSSAEFQFFDRFGNRHVVRGDDSLKPELIADGVQILGVTGSFETEGPAQGKAGDYVYGYTYKAVTGTIKTNCRNLVLPNTDLLPQNNVAGHSQTEPTENPWGDAKFACKQEGWSGTTCDKDSEGCVYQDLKTEKHWTFSGQTANTWVEAQKYCANSKAGSFNDWRLPTQKEAMQASINGISAHPNDPVRPTNNITPLYWTSTKSAVAVNDDKAWAVNLSLGIARLVSYAEADASRLLFMCVR